MVVYCLHTKQFFSNIDSVSVLFLSLRKNRHGGESCRNESSEGEALGKPGRLALCYALLGCKGRTAQLPPFDKVCKQRVS